MKLYLLSQTVCIGYDTYDSMVIAANNVDEALEEAAIEACRYGCPHSWPAAKDITVVEIGTAAEGIIPGAVVASFNAG